MTSDRTRSGAPAAPVAVTPLRALARAYTAEALQTLAEIMRDEGATAAARVAASNALLDRGYGKPGTVVSGDEEGGAVGFVGRVVLEGVRSGADG
jgi:hypothetical protein